MRIKCLICCLILVLLKSGGRLLYAQQASVLLEARLVDPTGAAIVGAHVGTERTFLVGAVSDEAGYFRLSVPELPVRLIFSHLNYQTTELLIEKRTDLPSQIVLAPAVLNLPDVTVRAQARLDTVYRQPYSVVDYAFFRDHLILLARKNDREGFSLVLLSPEEEVLAEFSLRKWKPRRLHTSCAGALFLVMASGVKEILIEERGLSFGPRISRDDFELGLANCVWANDSLAYFQRYYYQGQALEYYCGYRREPERALTQLPRIEDDPNIVRLIEESGCRLPWSGNIWEENVSGRLYRLREGRYQMQGMWRAFYPRLYAPLHPVDSLFCLFNHFASQLEYYDVEGELVREQAIDYHQEEKWMKKVYYDPYRQEAYTAFRRNWSAQFYQINLEDGSLRTSVEVELDFIENVQVWNGYLYFLYRNRGKQERNRILHRIRLY